MKIRRILFINFFSTGLLFMIFSGIMQESKAQSPLIWREEFEKGLGQLWSGSLNYFLLQQSKAMSCGPAEKSTLWLMRSLWTSNALQMRDSEIWSYARDSGLCWEGVFETEFNPSSSNYLRFYLWKSPWKWEGNIETEEARLLDTLGCSWFLQLGEKGGQNVWRLFCQQGRSCEEIWAGKEIYANNNGGVYHVRALLNHEGIWKVQCRESVDSTWHLEGDSLYIGWDRFLPDSLENKSLRMGFCAHYETVSRSKMFAVDALGLYGVGFDSREGEVEGGGEQDTTGGESEGISLWQVLPDSGSWRWSEILFETTSGKSKFIELYNCSDSILSPFYLYVGVKTEKSWKWNRLCKDTSLQILSGGYACWCKEKADLNGLYEPCFENLYTAFSFPTLDASCGELRLAWMSPWDTVYLESMRYSKEMHHLLLESNTDVSLERIGFKTSAMETENWQSASLQKKGATPGCCNSQYNGDLENEEREMGPYFEFSTRLLTPNDDGQNDYTEIFWNKALQGYVAKAELYDRYGRKVYVLTEEEILDARGHWNFKGIDNQGQKLRAGVYVWFIRIVHPKGKRKGLRYAFAIG